MRGGWVSWVIGGAIGLLLLFAGIDALRSSLGDTKAAVTAPTATRSTNVSNRDTACKRSQMVVAIEVRKPDETRPAWNQRGDRGWRAWQRTPVATLVVKNAGSSDCALVHGDGTYDFGIRDRAGRWMARWDGNNVFGGQYAPAEERSFSLPNVYSCDRPGPFRAMATVGPYSALLNRLTYSQVTCTSGRLTESAVGGKVTVRIALGNNGQDVSNGGVSGRGHFTATGAIADRGSATTYRTVKGSIPGGVITLRIVTVGKKGAITYLVTIDTGTGTSRWTASSGTKAYDGVQAHGVERENAAHTTSALIGTVSR